MKEYDLMNAMNELDDRYLLEAEQPAVKVRKSKKLWKRPAVIAACMCLVLAGTVFAAVNAGIHIDFFNGNDWFSKVDGSGNPHETGGYWPTTTVRVPVEEFSDEVQALAKKTEHKERTLGFDSWSEMENFVGLEVANNRLLDEASLVGEVKKTENRFYFNDEEHARGYGILFIRRDLEYLEMSSDYTLYNTIQVEVDATVVSDQVPEKTDFLEYGMASAFAEDMTVEEYAMANGQTATIISSSVLYESGELGPVSHTAVFQGSNAVIRVRASDLADEFSSMEKYRQQDALTTLKEVLDAFE